MIKKLLCISFLVLCCLFLIYNYRQLSILRAQSVVYESTAGQIKNDAYISFKIGVTDNNMQVGDLLKTYPDINTRSAFDKDNYPLLVYRFSELNCSTCVESTLSVTKRFFRGSRAKRLAFAVDMRNKKYYEQFIRLNQITAPVLHIPQYSLSLSADRIDQPYMFLLDAYGFVNHIFVPDKNDVEKTEFYLQTIAARYFK